MIHRITNYISYWLNALGRHSLQAPFIYQLYTEVINVKPSKDIFHSLRQLKNELAESDESILWIDFGATSKVQNGKSQQLSKIVRRGTSSDKKSQLLNRLAQFNNSKVIVELGTSIGINTCYLANNSTAKVFTFEGSEQLANIADGVFSSHSEANNVELIIGNIDQTLPKFLDSSSTVDFAFVDANHRYEPTITYFKQLKAVADHNTILVFDDIYWSKEMTEAWKYIIAQPEVSLSIDLFEVGLIFFRVDISKQHYKLNF